MPVPDKPPVDYAAYGPLYAFWARGLSFLGALGLAGLWLAMPQLVAVAPDEQTHILLPLGLWGIAAGLVHGIGYVPVLRIWRYLFSPYAGWPLMSLCAGLWLL